MAQGRWRTAFDDVSVWVADPEPEYHLAVWQGDRGWDWHVLDPRGEKIVQGWAEPNLTAAKATAEKCYRAHKEARSAPTKPRHGH